MPQLAVSSFDQFRSVIFRGNFHPKLRCCKEHDDLFWLSFPSPQMRAGSRGLWKESGDRVWQRVEGARSVDDLEVILKHDVVPITQCLRGVLGGEEEGQRLMIRVEGESPAKEPLVKGAEGEHNGQELLF